MRMLLIADSGSTKTHWRLVDESGQVVAKTKTAGLNPYFLTVREIADILVDEVVPKTRDVEKVFFYGAGCGSPAKAEQMAEALRVITARHQPEVAGDMLGSARSLLQDREGIACILGTGSNSCLYNGRDIAQVMPSLGFLFSDWGSGTVMSRDFIALLLQEKLPREIATDFHDTYRLGRVEVLDNIYNKPQPNRFLASFTPFLLKHAEEPLLRSVITENFRQFFSYYVLRYPGVKPGATVNFTGSIAKNFRVYLEEVARDMDIRIEQIVQHPMEGLVHYHCVTVPALVGPR